MPGAHNKSKLFCDIKRNLIGCPEAYKSQCYCSEMIEQWSFLGSSHVIADNREISDYSWRYGFQVMHDIVMYVITPMDFKGVLMGIPQRDLLGITVAVL